MTPEEKDIWIESAKAAFRNILGDADYLFDGCHDEGKLVNIVAIINQAKAFLPGSPEATVINSDCPLHGGSPNRPPTECESCSVIY